MQKKGKCSPYSITERRVPELIPVLGSQPAGDRILDLHAFGAKYLAHSHFHFHPQNIHTIQKSNYMGMLGLLYRVTVT